MPAFLLLSGYKLAIGAVVFGIGSAVELLGYPEGSLLKEWGGILIGIGGAHKLVKGPS